MAKSEAKTNLDLGKLRGVSKEMVIVHPHETGETLRLKVFGYTLTEINAIAATMLELAAENERLRKVEEFTKKFTRIAAREAASKGEADE